MGFPPLVGDTIQRLTWNGKEEHTTGAVLCAKLSSDLWRGVTIGAPPPKKKEQNLGRVDILRVLERLRVAYDYSFRVVSL